MTRPLATVGNVNVDLIMGPVDPWPAPGQETFCAYDELRVGGSAGNAALAWRGLGVPFEIAANTGDDRFGDWLNEALGRHAAGWTRAAAQTTVSVGLTHPGGERSFFTTNGHLPLLTWPEVEAMLDWPALAGGTLLLCGCFLMPGLSRDYPALFDRADALGITMALDTGWPPGGWTDALRAETMSWVARCGVVLFNEVEATSLTGLSDLDAAAEALTGAMPDGAIAAIKLGPNGALAHSAGRTFRRPAPDVVVRDTIGAGDVFNAGLLAALADDVPLDRALENAVQTASLAVSTEPRRYAVTMEVADEQA